MYNWVTTRKIARTDAPNYPTRAAQTVDAVVNKWIPAFTCLLACSMTPARAKLDSRYYEQPNYPVRAVQTVDVTVRTWIPAFDQEQQSYRTDARPPLDVRRYEWTPEQFDIVTRVDAQVRTWGPAFRAELESRRTDGRRLLDVRGYEWTVDETAWIAATLTPQATVAQTVPAWAFDGDRTPDRGRLDVRRYEWAPDESSWVIGETAGDNAHLWPAIEPDSFTTRARAKLDVRGYDWTTDEASWIQATQTQAPTVAQTAPAWVNHAQNFRTRSAPTLDVQRAQSIPDIFGVPDDWITWVPNQDDGGRTRDRARLDVRSYEWAPEPAWIFTALTPVDNSTVPQRLPATLQASGTNYRTPARPSLDVRFYDWIAWVQGVAAPPASVAQTSPAWTDDGGLTRDRARLDVRTYDWAPIFDWVQPVSNAAVVPWAPVFSGELASFRTPDRPRLDVRTYKWAPDEAAWELINFAPPVTPAQYWPALLENLGTQYQTTARTKLDVRAYDWAPEFTWAVKAVDLTVARWAPVFDAERRSGGMLPDHARLNVRALTDQPQIAWWVSVVSTAPPPLVGVHLEVADNAVTVITLADAAVTELEINDRLLEGF